jgi:hypothetical protein
MARVIDRIFDKNVFDSNTLNKFIATGKNKWSLTRKNSITLTGKHPKFTKQKKNGCFCSKSNITFSFKSR